jgi:hypothetical protein
MQPAPLTPVNDARAAAAYRTHMATATAPTDPPPVLALLRARAWVVPWALLAVVVGVSIAGAQRGSSNPRADLAGTAAAQAAQVALRCELRHSFTLRLAITAQMMARSFVPGAQSERVPGATCQVVTPP